MKNEMDRLNLFKDININQAVELFYYLQNN